MCVFHKRDEMPLRLGTFVRWWKKKTCVCASKLDVYKAHREKNDATSIPPKLTTDFMLIMHFPSAAFIATQLKHVQLPFAGIFQSHNVRLFPELTGEEKKMRQPLAKIFFDSRFQLEIHLIRWIFQSIQILTWFLLRLDPF